MSATTLPDDIRAALLRSAKGWVLGNYVGGEKRLDAWDDHKAHLVSIYSSSLPGPASRNLRRLLKLVQQGVLVERHRYRPTGTRSFTVPRALLDELGQQAIREWQAVGYRIGVLMPAIDKKD